MAQVLRPLKDIFRQEDYAQVLVGLTEPDDAAVFQIDERRAIISTTDFFPPVVDSAYDFGAIAAANALSDVYAMGGRPLMAINLVAFPDDLDKRILSEILRGGAEKVKEAGAVIAGGHSISDAEPKYGLCVTGEVNVDSIIRKSGAKPGDKLILSKPLGTGVITTALKRGIVEDRFPGFGSRDDVTSQPDGGGTGASSRRPRHDRHHRLWLGRPWAGDGET